VHDLYGTDFLVVREGPKLRHHLPPFIHKLSESRMILDSYVAAASTTVGGVGSRRMMSVQDVVATLDAAESLRTPFAPLSLILHSKRTFQAISIVMG
jgi:hypothetical protein